MILEILNSAAFCLFVWVLFLTAAVGRRPKQQQVAVPQLDCLCEHSVVMHTHNRDRTYGACQKGRGTTVACNCQGYHGPLPPEDLVKQLGLS